MVRIINADLTYPAYYSGFDWCKESCRSITRWGSGNDYTGADAEYNPSGPNLAYNPGEAVDELLFTYPMAGFRAVMGYRAIILKAALKFRQASSPSSGVFSMRLHAFLKAAGYPNLNSLNGQYKDKATSTKWGLGGYAPQLGIDITTSPVATASWDQATALSAFFAALDIRAYFAEQLVNGEDLWLDLFQVTSATAIKPGCGLATARPVLDLAYLFPLELFPEAVGGGEPDYSKLLSTDENPINLGVLQAGETGAPKAHYLVNFSRATIDHAELWDDFPQWSPPAAAAGNGGSGALAYVLPFEGCVSQKWEIKFDVGSSTDYEVKASAYSDKVTGLHPNYDGNANWKGSTAADWSDPEGNVTVPAAAWSGTPDPLDVFSCNTRGNTTDPAWAADANDQVEMAPDDPASPGTPLATGWRKITAQRIQTAAGVTIDAATKTVTVNHIDVTKWPVGTPCFIADRDHIDQGTVKSTTATTVEIENLTASGNVYAAGVIVATTLPIRDTVAAVWAQLTAASGTSETYPDRLNITAAAGYGFSGGATVYVKSLADPTVHEEIGVLSLGTNYLLTDGHLANDYEAGAQVIQKGSGWTRVHLRPATVATTPEELKEFRLNVVVL